jgi:hypothetical protein
MLSPNRLTQALTRVALRKMVFGFFLTGILLCTLSHVASGDVSESTFQGWQIEDRGGYCSESAGIIRLRSSGGDICPSITLYKQIAPVEDFNFSLQVNSATLESFGIYVGSRVPFFGSTDCVNFEFGHYGAGMFLLARRTTIDNWIWNHFADGVVDVWYTMQLTIYANPFKIMAEVLDDNGTLLGSFSASDMSNIPFKTSNIWVSECGDIQQLIIPSRISHVHLIPNRTTMNHIFQFQLNCHLPLLVQQ